MQQKTTNKIKSFDGVLKRHAKATEALGSANPTPKNSFLYSGLKMLGVMLVTVVLSVGLTKIGGTVSYFNDVEISIGNLLKADPLGFDVEVASSSSAQIDMSHGDQLVAPIMTPNIESELIQYFVTATVTGGDVDLCNAVHVLGTFPFPYDGTIGTLSTATSTETGSWALTFSLPDPSSFSNTSCTVDLVYKGWNADSPIGKGYHDTQKVTLTVYVPDLSLGQISPIITVSATTSPEINLTSGSGADATTTATTTPENLVPDSMPDTGGASSDLPPPPTTTDVAPDVTVNTDDTQQSNTVSQEDVSTDSANTTSGDEITAPTETASADTAPPPDESAQVSTPAADTSAVQQ